MVDVAERILELLKEKNMTQYQLAKAAGISQSSLNTIIKRGTSPSFGTVCKLCRALEVSLSYFAKEYEALEHDVYNVFKDELNESLRHTLYQSMLLEKNDITVLVKCAGIVEELRREVDSSVVADEKVKSLKGEGNELKDIEAIAADIIRHADKYDRLKANSDNLQFVAEEIPEDTSGGNKGGTGPSGIMADDSADYRE